MDMNDVILSVTFGLLVCATAYSSGVSIFRRNVADWIVDITGLLVQGTVIPLLQIYVVAVGLRFLAPNFAGVIDLSAFLSFSLCFVVIDYLYYWNHRMLHSRLLWPIHLVHHTARQMDVITTSRNTVWSSLFIVYLWGNGLMVYLLADIKPYLIAVTVTAILDLWRHSPLHPASKLGSVLGVFLILPQDHAWHHSSDKHNINFGANFNLWDKLHHTWYSSDDYPQQLGVLDELSLWQKLLWPFSFPSSGK
jgi:sterol desaturase/sphingolipid hydroxylase (fatty acid hydroxylase superfamily)